MGSFWHSFADMAALEAGGELVVDRGEGVFIWDEDGRRYLDATAGLWYCNVGYGREEIADAAAAQLRRLSAYSTFGDLSNRPAIELAERVAAFSPDPDSRVFLTSGGSDSIDTAAKMARRYWQLLGETDRTLFVTRENAYHGMHIAGTSLAGIEANAAGYGALVGDVVKVAWDSAEALRDVIAAATPERVAAFFCEPIIGAGGVFPPPPGYLAEVREICRQSGVLFVADEVITGFGRAGDWFASNRWELQPDIITCAKGITSGYLPMGGVIASPRVAEPFWTASGLWRHGYTYSGHATVAAVAMARHLGARRAPQARPPAGDRPCRGSHATGRAPDGGRGPGRGRRAGGNTALRRGDGRGPRASQASRSHVPRRGDHDQDPGHRRAPGFAGAGDRRSRAERAPGRLPRRPRRTGLSGGRPAERGRSRAGTKA